LERSSSKFKLWVAISTPFQANLFHPLIQSLKGKVDLLVTARDHDRILDILDAKGVDYKVVGRHGGRDLYGKLSAYAEVVSELMPLVNAEKPNMMITERWPEATRVAFGLNIPSWSLFYDEREFHVNRMVFPLSAKVFAPHFYTREELREQGVLGTSSIVWFKGFHTTYLKSCKPSEKDPFKEMGISHPVVLARAEPRFASFFPEERDILDETLKMLVSSQEYRRGDFSLLAMPRDEHQLRRMERIRVPILEKATPENPVFFADVVLGAAETMLMEAFVLCKPCVSAIYWDESRPVKELHKYIPHSTRPTELRSETLRLIDSKEAETFKKRAQRIVDLMDNLSEKITSEVRRLLEGEARVKKYRRRRSELDLYMEIVEIMSLRPSKLISLMHDTGISYNKLKALVNTLVRKGLVAESSSSEGKHYQATERGIDLLFDYKRIKEALE